jgi:lysozyme
MGRYDRITEILERDEGFRSKPYRCTAGKLTIGIGRNIEDRGITREEAQFLLNNDIKLSVAELRVKLPWFDRLDVVRQDILINMHFNLGWQRLSQFRNTLKAVEEGRYNDAADGMLESLWARQVGARAARLAESMKTGEYR